VFPELQFGYSYSTHPSTLNEGEVPEIFRFMFAYGTNGNVRDTCVPLIIAYVDCGVNTMSIIVGDVIGVELTVTV